LRQILAAGDILPVSLAIRLKDILPNCQLINVYGPTENSVYTTAYAVRGVSIVDRSIPIGRPIANDCCYILDKHLELLPIGIIGELYAAGDGIARGYLYNPELTAEKFVPNPFSAETAARLYKTGDLARHLPNGNIEFIGRADNQVKIRGCRIELGEIETIICQQPSIRYCKVIAIANQDGLKSLNAYVVLREDVILNQKELRSFIRLKLPDYMVPSLFIAISHIPLTPIGKVDRQALSELQIVTATDEEFVLPRNPTEEKLVEMWKKLLKLSMVSVTDNFFNLGGHSLLAMMMFADIEKTFNKKISVSILFQEDTIEKLARIIDAEVVLSATSHLVSIQGAGAKTPLFCIHPIDGEVIGYRNLALSLGKSQPLYGLQLGNEVVAAGISLEGLAAKYIREIYQIQPQGPYLLAGHSFGGTLAYEMAQQLYREGQKVGLLVLFDTKNPQQYSLRRSFSERMCQSLQKFINNGTKTPREYLTTRVKTEWGKLKKRTANLLRENESSEQVRHENVVKALLKANCGYKPQRYPGKIVVFRALDDKRYQEATDDLGWREVANEVIIYVVPGDHGSIIAEKNLPVLVPYLKECLREVQK